MMYNIYKSSSHVVTSHHSLADDLYHHSIISHATNEEETGQTSLQTLHLPLAVYKLVGFVYEKKQAS